MKIVSNPKKISRYGKIGLYTSLGSLAFLFIAVGLTLTFRNDLTTYSFIAMLLGLILSQVGVFFANRWGKSPRIDERITQGLKGLDDRYTLYHYVTPVPHLLTGPSGVLVLVPQYQAGTITYSNNRYHQQGVGFFSRLIGQEGVGKPDSDAKSYEADLVKFLKKSLPDNNVLPPIQSVIVFTNPKANVQAQDAPIPTMHVEKLKDFVRRMTKGQGTNPISVKQVQDLLPAEDVS
jgi:hypothetical protein